MLFAPKIGKFFFVASNKPKEDIYPGAGRKQILFASWENLLYVLAVPAPS